VWPGMVILLLLAKAPPPEKRPRLMLHTTSSIP
jgi:hypothetical protein